MHTNQPHGVLHNPLVHRGATDTTDSRMSKAAHN